MMNRCVIDVSFTAHCCDHVFSMFSQEKPSSAKKSKEKSKKSRKHDTLEKSTNLDMFSADGQQTTNKPMGYVNENFQEVSNPYYINELNVAGDTL